MSQKFRPKRSILTLRFKNNRLSLKWTVFSRTCLLLVCSKRNKSNSLLENYFPKTLVHFPLHLNIKQLIGSNRSKFHDWLNHNVPDWTVVLFLSSQKYHFLVELGMTLNSLGFVSQLNVLGSSKLKPQNSKSGNMLTPLIMILCFVSAWLEMNRLI